MSDVHDDERLIGSQDRLDFIHAAAALAAMSEKLCDEMTRVRDELVATRQYLRTVQEDRHRQLGQLTELTQLSRAATEDTGVIREVVERLDGLVSDLTTKLGSIKLPKWLGTLQGGD